MLVSEILIENDPGLFSKLKGFGGKVIASVAKSVGARIAVTLTAMFNEIVPKLDEYAVAYVQNGCQNRLSADMIKIRKDLTFSIARLLIDMIIVRGMWQLISKLVAVIPFVGPISAFFLSLSGGVAASRLFSYISIKLAENTDFMMDLSDLMVEWILQPKRMALISAIDPSLCKRVDLSYTGSELQQKADKVNKKFFEIIKKDPSLRKYLNQQKKSSLDSIS